MTERGRAQRAYARCLDMYDMDCAVGAARAIRRSALINASLRAGELIFFRSWIARSRIGCTYMLISRHGRQKGVDNVRASVFVTSAPPVWREDQALL